MNRNFNYNYNYYPNNMDRDMNNPKFFTEKEGYLRGNMFRNLYSQYKNYEPQTLRPTTEQEEMFLRMSEAEFAAHDLNLYLDLYPNDGNALDLFNRYRKEANRLMMDYEEKYGPILISSDSLDTSPFLWQTQIFPWNMEGLSNV